MWTIYENMKNGKGYIGMKNWKNLLKKMWKKDI